MAAVSLLALAAGCGSSKSGSPNTKTTTATASAASIKASLLRGVAQIRRVKDKHVLRARLARTLASLRRDRAATPAGRTGRRLAIEGFASTLNGTQSQIDFIENDSGNVEAATRDAKRAYSSLKRGANRLRAAGRVFGVRIGSLNGY